jgi:predicted acyl esterase
MSDGIQPAGEDLVKLLEGETETRPRYSESEIDRQTTQMTTRDGVRLATDLYLPPGGGRFPTVLIRTPYNRKWDVTADLLRKMAQHGYVGVTQDCRGTGDSEPEEWETFIYEMEDGADCAAWVAAQSFSDGFIGGAGPSYLANTQWAMALAPEMSAIAPEVGGLGGRRLNANWHMFMNAYARTVGKDTNYQGEKIVERKIYEVEREMLYETLTTGTYNEPLDPPMPKFVLERYPELEGLPLDAARTRLLERYCDLPAGERAQLVKELSGQDDITLNSLEKFPPYFGHQFHLDRHVTPIATDRALFGALKAPALVINGWYDWGINITMDTWELLERYAPPEVWERSRLLIDADAHFSPGYHEGGSGAEAPMQRRTPETAELLLRWFDWMREVPGAKPLPRATFSMTGGGGWWTADAWPPPGSRELCLYLGSGGQLTAEPSSDNSSESYTYDPFDPTPTMCGSLVSEVYVPGSGDVSSVQERSDVLTYTSDRLAADLDVVGPLRCELYASSSAQDTDFFVRLSDVFPDGRAIHLQNGVVRARFRDPEHPAPLEPGRPYRFEIDMWATANRFAKGHRIRIDVSSADFPRFDRNANLAGSDGEPTPARQTVYYGAERPSLVKLPILSSYRV